MNPAEIHLTITHLPIFGAFFAAITLVVGLIKKNNTLLLLGTAFMAMSAFGIMVAHNSGEAAEEIVEHLPGVSHDAIHEHEEAAEPLMPIAIITLITTAASLYCSKKKTHLLSKTSVVMLVLAFIMLGVGIRAGWMAGYIKHQEARAAVAPSEHHEHEEHEEH
jgi:hypothetical protein